jgi:CRP-like cAMP-binding protein
MVEGRVTDLTGSQLLKEAEELGILNIDVTGDQLSEEVVLAAIEATRQLNSRLDRDIIAQKLRKADSVVAAQYR